MAIELPAATDHITDFQAFSPVPEDLSPSSVTFPHDATRGEDTSLTTGLMGFGGARMAIDVRGILVYAVQIVFGTHEACNTPANTVAVSPILGK